MTADVKLLPLPEWQGDFMTESEFREEADTYARANVSHATAAKDAEIEALREQVSRLDEMHVELGRQLVAHEERAERLAEALRSAEGLAVCCMSVDGHSRRELRDIAEASLPNWLAALHPTAAQENDDA